MAELLSVGLDVGTTTTQLVVSRLTAQNRASAFAVPRMEITEREILYESPVGFTPLLSGELVDGEGIRKMVEREYAAAGLTPEAVDTGAVIITGETSRKENAASVLQALRQHAGQFVVATAGPELESVLAARGAGAVAASEKGPVLHMDIGGGTSNLALCRDGQVAAVGCMNVGGRLLKFDENGEVTYVSPVLKRYFQEKADSSASRRMTAEYGMEIARFLASILEMAAGRREKTEDYYRFLTSGTAELTVPEGVTVSFSGGVADCIEQEVPWQTYGDLGPLLGLAIRESSLCRGPYRLGQQTIRATVIGAGCHSMQLSGSTVFLKDAPLPVRDLPAVLLTEGEQELPREQLAALVRQRLAVTEGRGILCLPGWKAPAYRQITALADALAQGVDPRACYLAVEADMAKALGQAMALRLGSRARIVCIDGIQAGQGDYLDMGERVGPALTVAVKTLVFEK